MGELGFEIHCASDDVKMIYDAVMGEMDKHNACLAGFRAMESLSLETGAINPARAFLTSCFACWLAFVSELWD